MNRRRLESEAIRDSLLAVAGRLDPTMGGPSYRDFNVPRRTLYLMTIRSDRSSFGPLFDAADSTAMVDTRVVSTVAPQALFLLNNPFVLDAGRGPSPTASAARRTRPRRGSTGPIGWRSAARRPPRRSRSAAASSAGGRRPGGMGGLRAKSCSAAMNSCS